MIKKIFTAIVCSSLVFGTLGCGFTEGVKQGYEEATENNSTDNKSEDTQEKDNNKDSSKKETTTNNQEYKSIRDINTAKVYSGTNDAISYSNNLHSICALIIALGFNGKPPK